MVDFCATHTDCPITTERLEEHLVAESGKPAVVDAFGHFIYGFGPASPPPDLWLGDEIASPARLNRIVGMDVCCQDPALDPDGSAGTHIASVVAMPSTASADRHDATSVEIGPATFGPCLCDARPWYSLALISSVDEYQGRSPSSAGIPSSRLSRSYGPTTSSTVASKGPLSMSGITFPPGSMKSIAVSAVI
jgi:hypothetical protein